MIRQADRLVDAAEIREPVPHRPLHPDVLDLGVARRRDGLVEQPVGADAVAALGVGRGELDDDGLVLREVGGQVLHPDFLYACGVGRGSGGANQGGGAEDSGTK